MKIISVVPRLYPMIDGVGDYALFLAKELQKNYDINTHFLVGDPNWLKSSELKSSLDRDIFPISCLSSRNSKELFNSIHNNCSESKVILLHYVGHGFARRGCPFWLINGLKAWVKYSNQCKLITMFHELYESNGPIWRSNFWTSPLQKKLFLNILKLSHRCVTSNEYYAEEIRKNASSKILNLDVIPVFSNVGEIHQASSLQSRQKIIIVFGQSLARKYVYEKKMHGIVKACETLNIEQIYDIGSPTGLKLTEIAGIPVVETGELPKEKVSQIMSSSLAGYFSYAPGILAKSGIFASYCAHGMLPVSDHVHPSSSDNILPNVHYLVIETGSNKEDLGIYQLIANNSYNWYKQHQLSSHAHLIHKCISNCT